VVENGEGITTATGAVGDFDRRERARAVSVPVGDGAEAAGEPETEPKVRQGADEAPSDAIDGCLEAAARATSAGEGLRLRMNGKEEKVVFLRGACKVMVGNYEDLLPSGRHYRPASSDRLGDDRQQMGPGYPAAGLAIGLRLACQWQLDAG
jgi:hypothetical protein